MFIKLAMFYIYHIRVGLPFTGDGKMKVAELTSQAYETELVEKLRSGDLAAMGVLYNIYRDRLCTFVLRQLGGDQDMVEDIVQETFFVALDSIDKFRGDSQFYTWLCSIAYHKINDLYRRQSREGRSEKLPFSIEPTDLGWSRDAEPIASSEMETEETRQAVWQALVSLPRDYRRVLIFKYIEGVPVLQISRILGRSPKSVEGLLSRARKALRDSLVGAGIEATSFVLK
jgi:RNA polymerase sigma factor, sigma-70 family